MVGVGGIEGDVSADIEYENEGMGSSMSFWGATLSMVSFHKINTYSFVAYSLLF